MTQFWMGVVVGVFGTIVGLFILFGFILNDDFSEGILTWVAKRKNFPKVLGSVAAAALLVAVAGIGYAMWQAFKGIYIPWPVWALLIFGVFGILLWVFNPWEKDSDSREESEK